MKKFNKGDRVKYIGKYTPELKGKLGTIADIEGFDNIYVKWDNGSNKHRAVVPESLELASTAISIKPAQKAEIVGAKIGDRVAWLGLDGVKYHGAIAGIDVDRLELDVEGTPGVKRYINPHRVTLAPKPKRFKVGDAVAPRDYDLLPDGTVCAGGPYHPAAKVSGRWQLIAVESISPVDPRVTGRTIAYLPAGYERKENAAA